MRKARRVTSLLRSQSNLKRTLMLSKAFEVSKRLSFRIREMTKGAS
jgi:hypothetical protein